MPHINMKKCIWAAIVPVVLLPVFLYGMNCERMHTKVWDSLQMKSDIAEVSVENPRVNYISSPVGIDEEIFFSWEPGIKQEAYAIIVEKVLEEQQNPGQKDRVVWDSGIVHSSDAIQIAYEGEPLEDGCEYAYTVFAFDGDNKLYRSETAFFETAFVSGQAFADADMICMAPEESVYDGGQAVYYKNFEMQPKSLKKATFYGSALGVYDAYINGHRIGDDELKPGWTDYRNTLLYNTYDITPYVREDNIVAAMTGTGWWCGRNSFGVYGYNQPAFVCQIILEYTDGTKQVMNTGEDWHYYKDTAVRDADFFNGETYDANKLTAERISMGASVPEKEKKNAHISTDFSGEYKSFYGYNVKRLPENDRSPQRAYIYSGIEEDGSDFGCVNVSKRYGRSNMDATDTALRTVGTDGNVRETEYMFPLTLKKGETLIVDLGQNMTGVPHLEYKALKGTSIEILCAEMLNDSGEKERGNDGPKGSLYRANYRSAWTKVTVIAGDAKEPVSYEPKYYYSGFRYLSLTADADVIIYDFKGGFLGNSAPATGYIAVDNQPLEQLYRNTLWTQYNNFGLVATDCPQRDERIGWMGDLLSYAETSMYTQDLYGFYSKWIRDAEDAQAENGAYADVTPAVAVTGSGNGGWAEAGILIPLKIYEKYGDLEMLNNHYASMEAYMEYLEGVSIYDPQQLRMGPYTTYGDWLATQFTDATLLSALWYEADALAMTETAELLGKHDDVRKYKKLHKKINDYVMETYGERIRAAETLSQTEILFLLSYATLSDELEQLMVARLKQSIEDNGYKVMTGFAGTPLLLPVLTKYGMTEEAYRILLCEENPSWLYSVNQGATTVWERYDSYTAEDGFGDEGMNSFNHFNEGSVAQWMYESMLGISVDMKQEQPVIICPVIPPDDIAITRVSGWYDSVYGRIKLGWEKETDGSLRVRLTVPANVKAKVRLPMEDMSETVISGGEYEWKGKYKLLE
nr:family 78 glycoside hydrolase catalytic domain [Lachnospiraceae bacterium]